MDDSWMQEAERLTHLCGHLSTEPPTYINLEILYITKENTLDHKLKYKINLSHPMITKEQLISSVQAYKKNNYTCKDIFLFHIHIHPESMYKFAQEEISSSTFTKSYPILEDIILPPSIFIFHPYNTLFLIYYEHEKKLKSAMKCAIKYNKNTITKKVRLIVPPRLTRTQREPY